MVIKTQKYIRKPLYVDAVRVTEANFTEIASWCQGLIEDDEGKKYIRVRVHNPKNIRQSKAFVGDWLLYTERGYKVYTNKAFQAAFDPVEQNGPFNESVEIPSRAEELTTPSIMAKTSPPVGHEDVPHISQEPPAPTVESVPSQEKVQPSAVEGKRVLSIVEQRELSQAEIRELVQSGEAVLAQDIA